MDSRKSVFHLLGSIYISLYRIPIIGNWIVRGICRFFGFTGYLAALRRKHFDSLEDFADFFKKITGAGGIEIDISYIDNKQLEFTLKECPYGFCLPEQQDVCEAAMDMDRTLFGSYGFELTIIESIPGGSSVCRECLQLKNVPRDQASLWSQ
ncbi:MAG: hypothetical protein JW738_06605 [Actinobacteria bacterium]|nr:hypothetical protein [Actinomycetota bacterium]